ncbi:MAG: hypothetical protein ABGW95_02950, partial [Candidatus Poseidoniia archaeon]
MGDFTGSWSWRWLGLVSLLLAAGCERVPGAYPLFPEPGRSVARLIDRLDAAAIDSPLRGLDPAAVLAAASGKTVFEEDFESAAHPLRIRGGSCHAVRRSVGDQRGT